jgi:hypothetical protein
VNTYHWRNDVVALASASDYRFGFMRDQVRPWKAVIDEQAVGTPRTCGPSPHRHVRPRRQARVLDGEASQRSAQHERTAVHIYQPAWTSTDALLWLIFPYRDFTHALFPQERFDEVVQDGNWTFGRAGDGYVGIWSWRADLADPTPPSTTPAAWWSLSTWWPRRPDNVWIAEVGDASQGSFGDCWPPGWRRRSTSCAMPQASRSPDLARQRRPRLRFDWTLSRRRVRAGARRVPRHDAPWGRVERLSCCTRSPSATRRWSSTSRP